jgi:hypothetical protein
MATDRFEVGIVALAVAVLVSSSGCLAVEVAMDSRIAAVAAVEARHTYKLGGRRLVAVDETLKLRGVARSRGVL